MKTKIIMWTLVLLLTINLVLSIGISPAKTTVISENVDKYEGKFWIVNNDNLDFDVKIYASGDLSKYIKVEEEEIYFSSTDEMKEIQFKIEIPPDIPPGDWINYIVVEEELDNADPNVISSKLRLKHKIILKGPYPDKYVEVKLNFNDLGKEVEMISEVENLGKQDLEEVKTKFYVNDKEQKLQSAETEAVSLKTAENKLLIARMDKDLFERGEFEVSAVTTYDYLEVELIEKMRIGLPEVEVTYFDRYFLANMVNKYSMDLLNKWNKRVENVYVDVEIIKDEEKVDSFRTKSVDIEGYLTKRISDYFDGTDKDPGEYSFDLVVHFWNTYKMDSKRFPVSFLTEKDAQNIIGKAFGGDGIFNSTTVWIISVVILGLLILIVLLIYIMKKKDNLNLRKVYKGR